MSARSGFACGGGKPDSDVQLQTFLIFSAGESPGTLLSLADDLPGGRKALRCFLSPVDALIEASLEHAGNACKVVNVRAVARDAMSGVDPDRVVTCVHTAWQAIDGYARLRPNGRPVSNALLLSQRSSREIIFELDTETVEELRCMYEKAGLYAWRETLANVRGWDQARMDDTVQHAIRTMPAGRRASIGRNQSMLFDPEFRQWHFVPRDAIY